MKHLLLGILLSIIAVTGYAKETTYECKFYTITRLDKPNVQEEKPLRKVKVTIVRNDEGYYIPGGTAFPEDRHYFFIDKDENKASFGNDMLANVSIPEEIGFANYVLKEPVTDVRKALNEDLVYLILFRSCTIVR